MKKVLSLALIAIMVLSASFTCFGVNINIDEKPVQFTEKSGAPFIDSANRTQVPLRVTMEAYGCNVDWDGETRTAIVEKDGRVVKVPIGESYILINGDKKYNDTVAVIKNDRTYLPIRAVLEAFGATVDWDAASSTVIVKSDKASDVNFNLSYTTTVVKGNDTYKGIDIGDCHYEKLVFTNPNSSLSKINRLFDDKCSVFLTEDGKGFYDYGCIDIDAGGGYFPYYCTSDIDNVYISDKYISVKTKYHWYCGGVSNTNYFGYTFNTSTGNAASILDLFNGDYEKANYVIKKACLDYINNSPEYFFDDAAETINNYYLNEFEFYLDPDLNIILNTYEISPGASGPHIIKIKL